MLAFPENCIRLIKWGFPHSSVGKESACNAGELGLIPVSGRSPGEGNGNPLQYSYLENFHGLRSLVGYSPWGSQRVGHNWATSLFFLYFTRLHGSSTSFFKLLQISKNSSNIFIEKSLHKSGPVLFKPVHLRANCIFLTMAETYHVHTVLGAFQVLFHFLLKTALWRRYY